MAVAKSEIKQFPPSGFYIRRQQKFDCSILGHIQGGCTLGTSQQWGGWATLME